MIPKRKANRLGEKLGVSQGQMIKKIQMIILKEV
jgi:hypothetical protein